MDPKSKIAPPNILTCAHCGKITDHDLLHREDYVENIEKKNEGQHFGDNRWIAILKCKKCDKPSVYRNEWDGKQQKWVTALTYPILNQAPIEVPAKLRKIFGDAISVLKKSPSLTAVGIRKCLEGICDDKHAQGNTLTERIGYLGSNGIIPLPLSDMVNTSQTIGKIGSHFGNMDISLEEVNLLIEYTLAMFVCLYVVQDRIHSVQATIKNLG